MHQGWCAGSATKCRPAASPVTMARPRGSMRSGPIWWISGLSRRSAAMVPRDRRRRWCRSSRGNGLADGRKTCCADCPVTSAERRSTSHCRIVKGPWCPSIDRIRQGQRRSGYLEGRQRTLSCRIRRETDPDLEIARAMPETGRRRWAGCGNTYIASSKSQRAPDRKSCLEFSAAIF